MHIPTRSDLHAAVDERYFERHPSAPNPIDPHDPTHRPWRDAWLAIRDEVVNEWVDNIFSVVYPDAGRLDPDNPAHEQLIDAWLDLRDQIRDDAAPRYDWAGLEPAILTAEPYVPPTPTPAPTTPTAPEGDLLDGLTPEQEQSIKDTVAHISEYAHAGATAGEIATLIVEAAGEGHAAGLTASQLARIAPVASVAFQAIGGVATIAFVVVSLVDAFEYEQRRKVRQGYAYGLMWESMGEPDHWPKTAPGITYSAEEKLQAFQEGAAAGRAAAQGEARLRIVTAVAIGSLTSPGGTYGACFDVLDELWDRIREKPVGDRTPEHLNWPQPWDETVLGH